MRKTLVMTVLLMAAMCLIGAKASRSILRRWMEPELRCRTDWPTGI